MSAEFFTTCEWILSATANGVYQGALVAVIAGLALRFFPRTNAATRHAVWFGVLLFVAALIPAHLFLSFHPRTVTNIVPIAFDTADASMDYAPLPDPPPDEPDAPGREPVSDVPPEAEAAPKPLSWNLDTAISLPHSICLGLISAWALLASIRAGMLARRICEVRRVKSNSNPPCPALQGLFEKLRSSLAARRNVQLRISSAHRTAVVLGFIHPVVLLPAEMDKIAIDGEADLVLRHELAHVDRRDDWWNLTQQIIQAALFFHPAVWWICARISLEREIACDDHVLEASGTPRAYALTLANVAIRMSHERPLLAPAVSSHNSQLQQRITMILNMNRDKSPRLAKSRLGFFTTATAMLAVLAINAGPRLVLAQSLPELPAAIGTAIAPLSPIGGAAVSEAAPAAALPPDELLPESGPSTKSSGSFAAYAGVGTTTFSAPDAPTPPMAPTDPFVGARPAPPAPPSSVWAKKKTMSVEERLDRIERALGQLEAQPGAKGRHISGDFFASAAGPMGSGVFGRSVTDASADAAIKRAAEELKRAVEMAERNAEAGQRNAEQSARDIAKQKSKDYERWQEKYREIASESPVKELQALRDARESLEKQLQNLTRQIKRLEADQNRPKDSTRGQPDDPNKGPKQANPTAE